MLLRFSTLLLYLLVGAGLGAFAMQVWPLDHVPLLGAGIAGMLWFALDTSRAGRLLHVAKFDSWRAAAPIGGAWGEVADRVRRLLRERDASLAESQARLQDFLSALQASPNGVVLLDGDDRIEWCNQTAAVHFGFDIKRDLQQAIGNLVRDPGFVRYLGNRDYQSGLTLPGRDSTALHPVLLSVYLHPYGQGRTLLLSTDITAREQAEVMRRDFIANVSHEIRTPLTVISGFIETLQTLDLGAQERTQYLDLMGQQAARMQVLVSDLLLLSRLEGSPPPDLEVRTPLSPLMRQLRQDAMSLAHVIKARGDVVQQIDFVNGFDGQIAGASSELLSAMGNLVSNAIRYTPAGGVITVRTALMTDGGLQFSVQDTGPGIAPEYVSRLTERFYRVDRSRSRETGGTGLGLAIVKHVVQRHGAALEIESTPGKGSSFTITFPPALVSALP